MPIYFLTATDKYGKRETHRTEAENSQKVYYEYESNGFTDIVLHDDDAMATVNSMFPPEMNTEGCFTPDELVEMRYLSRFDIFLFMMKKLIHLLQWPFLVTSILLFYRWREQTALNHVDLGLISASIIASFWHAYFSHARKYDKMVNACYWGRWQEVLNRIPKLKGIVPAFDLSGHEACALTGLGQLDDGLELMEHYVESPEVPRWMYLGRLSDLYEIAKDYKQVIECNRIAYEEAPDNPTVVIDYAHVILKYDTDLALAKQLLDQAEQQHLGEMIQLLWYHFKGILELKLHNYKGAQAHFLVCHNGMIPLAPTLPSLQLMVDFNRAYLAIALAELGETEQADELYQLALPRLQALGEELIMNRYAEAIA